MRVAMQSHKITAFKHGCVKSNSGNTATNGRLIKSFEATFNINQDNIFRLLEAVGGDLLEASSVLDTKLEATNKLIQELTESSKSMSDDEFYNRLTDLKNEHKKTLNMCEKLYTLSTQRGEKPQKGQRTVTFEDTARSNTSDMVRESLVELERQIDLDESVSPYFELSNSFSKPPIPRPSRGVPTKVVDDPLSPDHEREAVWSAAAMDSDTSSVGHEDLDEQQLKEQYRDLLKTQAMWNDYNDSGETRQNLQRRARSGSLDRSWSRNDRDIAASLRQTGALAATENWRHRITIPEPFTMTLKEEAAAKENKKSQSQILFEKEKLERELAEEAECSSQFKANPVPAHVYMPLYDEINEKQNAKREFVKQFSKEILKSQEKPFTFMEREKEKKIQQKERVKEADKVGNYHRSTHGDRFQLAVKAKTIPKSTYPDHGQKLKEDELLRQIKIKMRAENMLRKSAEPSGMAERQKKQQEKRQIKLSESMRRSNSADGRPRVGRDAPNFDHLHKAFEWERMQKQAGVKITYPKPFNLKTEQRGEINQKKFMETLEQSKDPKTTKNLHDYSHSYPSNRDIGVVDSLIEYEHVPPTRLTRKDMVMNSARRSARENYVKSKKQDLAIQKKRERMRRELAESLRTSTEFNATRGPSIDDMRKSKLENQKQLELEYRQKMLELDRRMKERDLLIVQQQKLMAKQKAEAQYRRTLTNAGVDPENVDHQSRDCREGDIAAYTTAGYSDLTSTDVTSTVDTEKGMDETQLNESRFGAPSPILELQ